jgi:phage terminase large subunit-like protein
LQRCARLLSWNCFGLFGSPDSFLSGGMEHRNWIIALLFNPDVSMSSFSGLQLRI